MLKLGLCYILLQQLKLLTSMYLQNDLVHTLYMFYHSQTFIKGLSTNVWPSLCCAGGACSSSFKVDHCIELCGWVACPKKQKIASLLLDDATWANSHFALLCELIVLPSSPAYDLEIAMWKLIHRWKN